MSAEREFLIDLVRINNSLRIALLREERITMFDIIRQTGLCDDRIIHVLVLALTSDYRDLQQELLASVLDFTDAPAEVHSAEEARFIRNAYPPLPVYAALTGLAEDKVAGLHVNWRPMLRGALEQTYGELRKEWVASNLVSAKMVIGNDGSFRAPEVELTDTAITEKLSEAFKIDPEDITIIGSI